MAQLLAGGIIALGLFIIALAIFLTVQAQKIEEATSIPQPEVQMTPPEPEIASVSAPQQAEAKEVVAPQSALAVTTQDKPPIQLLREDGQSLVWWQTQIHSLTAQLQYLREHAKDVERQIAILSEIAALVAELEMLQKKRDILPEGKIALFPLQVHRQPTDMSYVTDKRPAMRKYTIEAMS